MSWFRKLLGKDKQSRPAPGQLGILFDIQRLGSNYGYTAYRIFFDAVDTRQLVYCWLSDGDTNATLASRAGHYCIAVEATDIAQTHYIREALSRSTAAGLLPLPSRFLEGTQLSGEPLVIAAQIDGNGDIANCQTSWIIAAWNESAQKRRSASEARVQSAEQQIDQQADMLRSLGFTVEGIESAKEEVRRAEATRPNAAWFDETVATLVSLYRTHPEGFSRDDPQTVEIRRIGQMLNEKGGFDLMLTAHAEFSRKCNVLGAARNLEYRWDGIGGWRG